MSAVTLRRRWTAAAGTAALVLTMTSVQAGTAAAATTGGSGVSGTASSTSNVPYSLPVKLPSAKTSPVVDAAAPYTPVVLSLIAQLEPDNPPTAAEIANADQMLIGVSNSSCHNVGSNGAPSGTTPAISPLCWTDGLGVGVTSGPNAGKTTAPATLVSLGSSFDRNLANAWGQAEGGEARALMATGLLGPQADTTVYPNWGRGLDTPGEDPLVNGEISAAQINGLQGVGAMSQVKHFATNQGQGDNVPTTVQDQALHEVILTNYEDSLVKGGAGAVMCSYQIFQDVGSGVPSTGVPTLSQTSPYSDGTTPTTWPLNEMHYACEQPLTMNYILRGMWGSKTLVGPDYGGVHSASSILQGLDMEPGSSIFGTTNLTNTDPTGDTCADSTGTAVSCTASGAVHVAGIPGTGCGTNGCSVANAVTAGALPVSVFNQSLATMLYQEQRFGLLGCDNSSADCANPGGVDGDRTGTAALPTGTDTGAVVTGTKNGDAAVVEKQAEEGATLLKNNSSALPLTKSDLRQGVAVIGAGAQYTVASPTAEGSTGFADRVAINPLQQLKALSGDSSAFSYTPVADATGAAVPSTVLSTSNTSTTGNLSRTTGPGSPSTDSSLDFTTASGNGQLAAGTYTWTGYVNVPTADTYTFRFQYGSAVTGSPVTFAVDGTNQALSTASTFYHGAYYGFTGVSVSPTNAGYTEAGLTNVQASAAALTAGYHQVSITFTNSSSAASSFRFAYNRVNGDIAAAAAAAAGKSKAVVFVNDESRATVGTPPFTVPTGKQVSSLSSDQIRLIGAVSAANPNTVVVLNTSLAIVTKEWINLPGVKSVLEMWNSGSEGGTATARLLLGQANPSGHSTVTWPLNNNDTLYSYDQTSPLYAGDTTGTHPERGPGQAAVDWTQGIYSGYRYYDKLNIPVQFPFGYGLSYSSFNFSNLNVTKTADGGLDVTFKLKNTSNVAGAEVPQVYLGAPSTQPAGVQFAVRALAQFDRVQLAAGESKTVTEHVALRQLQYWSSAKQQWVLATGSRTVYVGDADMLGRLPLRTTVTTSTPADTSCINGQINTTTIAGNLNIPAGAWCDLVNVKITGSLTADKSSGLRIVGSTINGNVSIRGLSKAADPLASGANTICGTTIKGSLTVAGSSRNAPVVIGACNPNTVKGSVSLTGNKSMANAITATTVSGDLSCSGNAGISNVRNTVTGASTGQCALSTTLIRKN